MFLVTIYADTETNISETSDTNSHPQHWPRTSDCLIYRQWHFTKRHVSSSPHDITIFVWSNAVRNRYFSCLSTIRSHNEWHQSCSHGRHIHIDHKMSLKVHRWVYHAISACSRIVGTRVLMCVCVGARVCVFARVCVRVVVLFVSNSVPKLISMSIADLK